MENLVGKKFNRLIIISYGKKKHSVLALCDCGIQREYYVYNLLSGHTKSCGCFGIEGTKNRVTTHGKSKSNLYSIWCDIKRRCLSPNRGAYKDYGGRGIKICSQWLNDFVVFYNWAIENGWSKNLEIDRIDNNGDYSPSNCRIVTRKTNANNKRTNFVITFNGQTQTLSQWAAQYKMRPNVLYTRVKNRWEMGKALTHPIRKTKRFNPINNISYSFGHIN